MLFVGATLTNSTNETINQSFLNNITPTVNGTVKNLGNVTLKNQTIENLTLTNESFQNNTETNQTFEDKSIIIDLKYNAGTPHDPDNNGIETTFNLIDFTVEDSTFNWNINENNLCTQWDIYSEENKTSTIVCYGSRQCCNFIDLIPTRSSWNEIFYLNYGQYGATSNNKVSARVIHVDYNLSLENPYSNVYYSNWSSLTAKFTEHIITNLLTKIKQVVINSISVLRGTVLQIQATLNYENESPVPSEKIDFYRNNTWIGSDITDISGLAVFELNTSTFIPGYYLINATYAGQQTINWQETVNIIPSFNFTFVEILDNGSLAVNQTLIQNLTNEFKKRIEKNKNKLNIETESFLKEVKNKELQKEFLIKFKDTIDESKLSKVSKIKNIEKFKIVKIKGKVKYVEELLDDSEIEFVELEQNIEVLEETIPFNVQQVKADQFWAKSKGFGVKVAVLDTGIASHSDLNVAGGHSVVSSNYNDNNGHGTTVSGVISAIIDNEGLVGVSPEIDLYAVKIMESSSGSLSDAIAGLEWAINNSMDIVSMSFGFQSYSQIFKEVAQEVYDNDILLVAAAGNNGNDNILYPAKYNKVIAVGALDEKNERASFSSYGFDMELVAPGVSINSTSLNNQYATSSGTSMSAPHVTGVAALIKSYNNSLTNTQIRNKLRNDAFDLGDNDWDWSYGYGLVQANLDTFDFTPHNDSYLYNIYNITNYNTPLQKNIFWIENTGHIDDVYFNPGIYLVNITKFDVNRHYIYNVSENGSIFILTTSLIFTDFFSTEGGTTSDGVAWIDDNITVEIDSNLNIVEVECFTIGNPQPLNTFDYCFSENQSLLDECDDNDPDILCDATHTDCSVVAQVETPREIIDYTFAHFNSSEAKAIGDCTDVGGTEESTGSSTYYVVEKKAALCINDTHYNVSGWHGTNWIRYDEDTCAAGTKCVGTQNFTTESANINPCIAENLCTGTIQIITEDRDGNPVPNLRVSRDDISNKTTDDFGVASYDLTQTCGQNLKFTAYCLNNITVCNSHTTALDKIDDFEGKLFDCSICTDIVDFQLNVEDVNANKEDNEAKVNISLFNVPVTSNINVTLKVQSNDGLIAREVHHTFSTINGQRFESFTQSITLNDEDDFLHIYVDATDKIVENNEKNNYALVPLFEKEIDVYFDINVGYPKVNDKIKEYIKLFVNEETIQANADVTLCVGRRCSNFDSLNDFTLNSGLKKQNFGYKNNKLVFDGKDVGKGKPYNAIVGGFWNDLDGKRYVMAYGNDIDGDIAAVKKLISARDLFLNPDLLFEDRTKVIDDFDTTGITVVDLLRNPSNFPYYNRNRSSDRFATVVERILTNNNFEIAIQTVETLNETSYNQRTKLRLKNVNSDFSDNFKEVITNGTKPVVMSGGIFSNLVTWEDKGKGLARDLVNDGHDVWEIEMSGGDNIECDTCPDYTYQDQVDYFWPLLVAGVMNYSGKNQVNYVGHSNGCRAALSSLNSYSSGKNGTGFAFNTVTGLYDINISLPNKPVDKFFGLGCPAKLNDASLTGDTLRENLLFSSETKGDFAIRKLNESGNTHISRTQFGKLVSLISIPFTLGGHKISLNLMSFYNNLYQDELSSFDLSSVNLDAIYLFGGTKERPFTSIVSNNDGAVPTSDITYINNSISHSQGDVILKHETHRNLIEDNSIKKRIKEVLNE